MLKKLMYIIILLNILSCRSVDSPIVELVNFSGYALIYDSNHQIYKNNSGILVEVLGTDKSTYTDSLGKWEIKHVPIDEERTVLFTKEGIIPYKRFRYPYFESRTIIYEIPSYHIAFQDVTANDDGILVTGKFVDNVRGSAITFLDTTNLVSSSRKHHVYGLFSPTRLDTFYRFNFSYSNLSESGIKSGQKCYIKSYPMALPEGMDIYNVDPETGEFCWNVITEYGSDIDTMTIRF